MIERLEKPPRSAEKSPVSAESRARAMLCDLAGQRGWHDTRESWLARGARKAGITLRRAKALFYEEPLRLSANEYLGIEHAHKTAHAALAALSVLASAADLRARASDGARGGEAGRDRGSPDRREHQATDAADGLGR